MKTLTITEALKAGYTKYCLANDGFQFLKDIDGVDKEHLLREDIRLACNIIAVEQFTQFDIL